MMGISVRTDGHIQHGRGGAGSPAPGGRDDIRPLLSFLTAHHHHRNRIHHVSRPPILFRHRFSPFLIPQYKKNPAPQDSPPAAGRESGILPIRRSAIPAERFYITGNEVSCYVKTAASKASQLLGSPLSHFMQKQPESPALRRQFRPLPFHSSCCILSARSLLLRGDHQRRNELFLSGHYARQGHNLRTLL